MYYYPTVSKVQVKIPTNGGLNLPGIFQEILNKIFCRFTFIMVYINKLIIITSIDSCDHWKNGSDVTDNYIQWS